GERPRIAEGEDVRAVALDQAGPVVGEAPAFAGIPVLGDLFERRERVDRGDALPPAELDQAVAGERQPLAEDVAWIVRAADHLPGRRLDLAQARLPVEPGALVERARVPEQALRVRARIVRVAGE